MTHREQDSNMETVGQRLIAYIRKHTVPRPPEEGVDVIREGHWAIQAPAPRLGDIAYFVEHTLEGHEGHTADELAYGIGLSTKNGEGVFFTYEPTNTEAPFAYLGTASVHEVTEEDMGNILDRLQAYDDNGQMVQIVRPPDPQM